MRVGGYVTYLARIPAQNPNDIRAHLFPRRELRQALRHACLLLYLFPQTRCDHVLQHTDGRAHITVWLPDSASSLTLGKHALVNAVRVVRSVNRSSLAQVVTRLLPEITISFALRRGPWPGVVWQVEREQRSTRRFVRQGPRGRRTRGLLACQA